jgi:hypothetical protein
MSKDWTGNSRSPFAAIGARTFAREERQEDDYYASEPKAARLLMELEELSPLIWECACGEGHLAKEFEKAGHEVYATDIVNRGFGKQADFLSINSTIRNCDIVTNPPYSKALEFTEHALEIVDDGHKVAMFLKIQFLEGKSRRRLFDKYPPKTVYVSTSRLYCAKNGDFEKCGKASAVCYAWFVWVKGFQGDTVVKWMN